MGRTPHTLDETLEALRLRGSEENRTGMARFGIDISNALGVSMPEIRKVASLITRDHELADKLWQSGIHEARILAAFVDRPQWVTGEQMDRWAAGFNSWDVCDQVCGNLWDRAPDRDSKIPRWASDKREFVRRAAFATIAWRAVHDKIAPDSDFLGYFALIHAASDDDRNFVRKAVNWALRQIGKRSASLHGPALAVANELAASQEAAARWIGTNAARELDSEKVRQRLGLP